MKPVSAQRRGVVLVITLAAVVLLTVLILAFFSRARLNGQISYSATNNIKSDFLAHSALNILTGELRQEIVAGSTAQYAGDPSYPANYSPNTPADFVPKLSGLTPNNPDPVGLANLIAVSADGAAIYPGGRVLGSALSISTPSMNGRSFSSARWFGAGYGPQLGTQPTLPTWTLVSRDNGIEVDPAITAARDPNQKGYVIGRFAYTVYDVAGLLNVNVAGFPSIAAPAAGYKSAEAYADLTQIPGFNNGADSLAQWRDGQTDTASAVAYSGYLTNFAKPYGFIQMKEGHNVFLTRQDFLNATANGIAGLSALSPGYLTTFSRASIAPDSTPPAQTGAYSGSSINYAANADKAGTANRNFPNVRFTAAAMITHYSDTGNPTSYNVLSGAPLVQRRFSLAKTSWLTPQGILANIPAAAVQACFGLTWDPTNERWLYEGSTGTSLTSSIETLDLVAGEKREPNFFELLKAGILSGSLGAYGANGVATATGIGATFAPLYPQQALDNISDFQIIRIGANIIDCAGANNYPTVIAFSFSPVSGQSPITIEAAGIKDLPYMQTILTTTLRQGTLQPNPPPGGSGFPNPPNTQIPSFSAMDYVWAPMFFNPHRASGTAVSGPSKLQFQFTPSSSSGSSVNYLRSITLPIPASPRGDLTALPPLPMSSAQFETFRSTPQLLTGSANDPTSLRHLVPYATGNNATAYCWLMFSYENAGVISAAHPQNPISPTFRLYEADNVMIRSQYQSPSGLMKTYATFWAADALAPLMGPFSNDNGPPADQDNLNVADLSGSYFINLWDPRSNRFSPSYGYTMTPPAAPALTAGTMGNIHSKVPFSGQGTSNFVYTLWPEGAKTQGTGTYLCTNTSDNDGLFRPADSWLDPSTNLYRNLSTSGFAGRPVILQRPFLSVGELGYVFRDSAWKTLNFFDGTSADSALLTLFSIADEPPVTADLVHLDSRQVLTSQALLSNAGQEIDGGTPLTSPSALAQALNSYLYSTGTPTPNLLTGVSQLPNFLMSLNGNNTVGLDFFKSHRESVVRTLGNNTQTRTWNLLLDVVAQVGHYPPTATGLSQFVVEGEKRYWLSLAIDRYSGKIIDQQLEPSNE
jgi:Tfp pilus assembly protein PilX